MLKADIDSGATGDKIAAYDPGLSQLGTDDEAAGHAPSHIASPWLARPRRFPLTSGGLRGPVAWMPGSCWDSARSSAASGQC